MVIARDALAVAERTRREGNRLLAAWRDLDAKGRALAAIVQCPSVNEGVGQVRCDLLEGHTVKHRHRVTGTQIILEWE